MPPPEAGMGLLEYLWMLLIAGVVTYGRQALEVVAKNIPDDATGGQAIVRDVCKMIAGYTKNKEHADKPKEPQP